MKLRIPKKKEEYIDQLRDYQLLREDPDPWSLVIK
jgi:hypothetical protein